MTYPAVGFGRPLPPSFMSGASRSAAALTPYDRAASALAWRPTTAWSQATRTSPSAPADQGRVLDGFLRELQAMFDRLLGAGAPGEMPDGAVEDGTPPTPDPAATTGGARTERGGQSRTGQSGTGQSGTGQSGTGQSGAGTALTAAGASGGRSSGAPLAAASSGGGQFGARPVDISGVPGLALGALGAVPGIGGILGTLAGTGLRLNNMLAAQQMLEDAGLPGYEADQWAGGLLGWNSYGSGSPNSPIGYTEDGTAISPSGYQYGTDGFLGPLLDIFGAGWSYAIDPVNAGRAPTERSVRPGMTTANPRQMPDAMRRDIRAARPPSAGLPTGGSSNAGSRPANVSAHAQGAGFTQQDRSGSVGAGVAGGAATAGRATPQRGAAQVAP